MRTGLLFRDFASNFSAILRAGGHTHLSRLQVRAAERSTIASERSTSSLPTSRFSTFRDVSFTVTLCSQFLWYSDILSKFYRSAAEAKGVIRRGASSDRTQSIVDAGKYVYISHIFLRWINTHLHLTLTSIVSCVQPLTLFIILSKLLLDFWSGLQLLQSHNARGLPCPMESDGRFSGSVLLYGC